MPSARFASWEGNAANFAYATGATMGPFFGIILVDYYLIAKGEVNVEALNQENGECRFTNSWNINALIAIAIESLFSSILPMMTNMLPDWWPIYGWFFGVLIGGTVYYIAMKLSPYRQLA